MPKQIAKLLKTDVMADIDMPAIAQFLQSQGRRGDSILAHINPKEAALLQSMGGAATPNPVTGLPEFYDSDSRYEQDINDIVTEQRLRQYQQPQEFDYSAATTPIIEPTGGRTISADYIKDTNVNKPSYPTDGSFSFYRGTKEPSPYLEYNPRRLPKEPMFTGAGDLSEPSYATRFTPNPFSDNLGLEMAARRDGEEYRGAGSFARYLPGTLNLAPVPENISRIPSEFATRPDLPEEIAAEIGSINYEIVSTVMPRVPRRYSA